MQFKAGPLVSLSMSCASYLGTGHRIEFFGEDGTLVLHNPGADYMRGFELFHAKRPAAALERIAGQRSGRRAISRRPHRAGVAAGQAFFRRHRKRRHATPGFAEGYRVQRLIDAARRSHSKAPGSMSRTRQRKEGARA